MDQPPPILDSSAPAPAPLPARTSLAARLLNVFAVPGEVFEEVKASPPCAANWIVPAAIFAVVGAVAAWIMFSQPAILQKLREQQEQKFEELVSQRKMTRQDADKASALAEKFMGPTTMKLLGATGSAFMAVGRVFWWALVLWLLARVFFKVNFSYMKAAEVAGLAGMIAVLGAIVTMLLTVNMGKMGATPSLALAVGEFDLKNKTHLLLGAINVVNLWQVAVMAVGLSRLAAVTFVRAGLAVFLFWAIWQLLLIFSGLGQMAL